MASFSSGDVLRMHDWLEGSKNYVTKVSIVARWSTKIPNTSYDTDTGLSPIADPEADLNILETGTESEEQEIEDIYNVRLKRSGLSHDLKFRASTLNFVFPDYAQFKQGKSERAIRFYLKVSLVYSVAGIETELILLKTDWYKIKSTKEIYSTSKSSGADIQIEATPWIYEYNEPTMEGNDARAWIEGNQFYWGGSVTGPLGTVGGYDPNWFTVTEGNSTSTRTVYLRDLLDSGVSIVAIGIPSIGVGVGNSDSTELYAFMSNGLRIPTGISSTLTVESWSINGDTVTITYEGGGTASFSCAPASLTGQSGVSYTYHLDGGKWDRNGENTFVGIQSTRYTNTPMSYRVSWNGITRVQKILHDRLVEGSEAPCSYTGPFVFYSASCGTNSNRHSVVKAVSAVLNMGPMRLVGSCDETALSYLSWWGLKEGAAIRPRSYIKDERVLDTPLVEFYELGYRIEHNELDYISYHSVNDFDAIENSDEKVVFDERYKYDVSRYLVTIPTHSYNYYVNIVGEDGKVTQEAVPPTYIDWCWANSIVKMSYSVGGEDIYAKGLIEGQLNFKDVRDYSGLENNILSLSGLIPTSKKEAIRTEQFYANMNWADENNFEYFVSPDWIITKTGNTSVSLSGITLDSQSLGLGYPTPPIEIPISQDNPRNFKGTSLGGTVRTSYSEDTKILTCVAYGPSPGKKILFSVTYDYDYKEAIDGLDTTLFSSIYLSSISESQIVGTEGETIQVDTHGAMDIDNFTGFNEIEFTRGDLLEQYAEKKKGIKFNAEWRPWIRIYSKIRVKAMNSFGVNYWVTAMITSIDANADSMSASYEGIVLEEEAA